VAAAVRCAPPQNKPAPAERDACEPWLAAELGLVASGLRVVVCLGQFAWQVVWSLAGRSGYGVPRPRPGFGHGAEAVMSRPGPAAEPILVLGCYHPSQQNTFTGRVTAAMLDEVFGRAARQAGL
jgi:uracil-DNA glycosylase